jgi:hypothetical protein
MSESFDPYDTWLGIPPHEQPANHYRLLGLSVFEANVDVISTAADRAMLHLRAFQAGQRGKESEQLLNEVAEARITLLDPEKKSAYDARLQASLQARSPKIAMPPPVAPPPVAPVAPPRVPAGPEQIEGMAMTTPVIQIDRPPLATVESQRAARPAARRRKPTPAIVIILLVAAALVAFGGGMAFFVSRIGGFDSSAKNWPGPVLVGSHCLLAHGVLFHCC